MIAAARVVLARDLRIVLRRPGDAATALLFFVIVVSLFPLGVGAEVAVARMTFYWKPG